MKKDIKEYTNRTIKHYDSIAADYVDGTAAVVVNKQIDQFISLLEGKVVLDLACGPGHDSDYLSDNNLICYGADLSAGMLSIAKKRYPGEFVRMNFFHLGFAENVFDGVWASSTVVHADRQDLPGVLSSLRKTIKDQGILGIITVKKIDKPENPEDPRKYSMYGQQELEDYLKQEGFEIVVSDVFEYGSKDRLFIVARNHKNE
jgi:ubiquinone/menaquinone biosynthesis C-methylase UbiE